MWVYVYILRAYYLKDHVWDLYILSNCFNASAITLRFSNRTKKWYLTINVLKILLSDCDCRYITTSVNHYIRLFIIKCMIESTCNEFTSKINMHCSKNGKLTINLEVYFQEGFWLVQVRILRYILYLQSSLASTKESWRSIHWCMCGIGGPI